jgi:hypothetical protein
VAESSLQPVIVPLEPFEDLVLPLPPRQLSNILIVAQFAAVQSSATLPFSAVFPRTELWLATGPC